MLRGIHVWDSAAVLCKSLGNYSGKNCKKFAKEIRKDQLGTLNSSVSFDDQSRKKVEFVWKHWKKLLANTQSSSSQSFHTNFIETLSTTFRAAKLDRLPLHVLQTIAVPTVVKFIYSTFRLRHVPSESESGREHFQHLITRATRVNPFCVRVGSRCSFMLCQMASVLHELKIY